MEEEIKRTFIVIGKTGAGNSAILNSLVGWEKFPEGGQLTSKTKEVCEYKGKPKHDDAIYNIIDTPGFHDHFIEQIKHINNIVKFLKNLKEFRGINCIFYVISLKEQMLNNTIQTYLSLLRNLLGDDLFKRIKIIYTYKNELTPKAFTKALDRFRDLPELLIASGLPVDENLETFIFDYDEPEEFSHKIISCVKQSPKFYPEVLDHLDNIDFDIADPVIVYKSLLDNSQFCTSLNDQLNKLGEVSQNYEKQSQKFEEEKRVFEEKEKKFQEEMTKNQEELKRLSDYSRIGK